MWWFVSVKNKGQNVRLAGREFSPKEIYAVLLIFVIPMLYFGAVGSTVFWLIGTCVCACVHVCGWVWVCICMCVYVGGWVFVCACVVRLCVCVCVCTGVHTYLLTWSLVPCVHVSASASLGVSLVIVVTHGVLLAENLDSTDDIQLEEVTVS